jgi:hypothetical protein
MPGPRVNSLDGTIRGSPELLVTSPMRPPKGTVQVFKEVIAPAWAGAVRWAGTALALSGPDAAVGTEGGSRHAAHTVRSLERNFFQ